MRLFKILGLAAIAAVAAMAFIASSASADTLCEEELEGGAECPLLSRVELPATLHGKTGAGEKAVLLSGFAEVKCESTALGEVKTNHGKHKGLLGLLTELTFTNCLGDCGKATAENLPYLWLAFGKQQHAIFHKHEEKPIPAALLSECPFNSSCLYDVELPLLELLKGDPPVMDALVELLRKAGHSFLCSEKATWHAKYKLTTLVLGVEKLVKSLTGLP